MMFKYLQPKQNPGSKTGLQTTAIFMLAIVGIFSALLLSNIYLTVSFFAEDPVNTTHYPLVTHNNFQRVQGSALNSDKLILVFLRTENCFPCELMKKQLFEDPLLSNFINRNFIFFEYDEFSASNEREVKAHALLNNRLPSLLVSDASGNIQGQISDIFDAKVIHIQLKNLVTYTNSELSDRNSLETTFSLNLDTVYKDYYGLEVDLAYDYYAARQLALEYKYLWNKGVWIQQQPAGHYRIILGTFNSSFKAQISRNMLHLWKDVDSKVVQLKMDGEIY